MANQSNSHPAGSQACCKDEAQVQASAGGWKEKKGTPKFSSEQTPRGYPPKICTGCTAVWQGAHHQPRGKAIPVCVPEGFPIWRKSNTVIKSAGDSGMRNSFSSLGTMISKMERLLLWVYVILCIYFIPKSQKHKIIPMLLPQMPVTAGVGLG